MYAKWAKKRKLCIKVCGNARFLKRPNSIFLSKNHFAFPPQRIFQTMLIFFSFGACHIVVLIKFHFFKILDHCANEYALLQTALAPP